MGNGITLDEGSKGLSATMIDDAATRYGRIIAIDQENTEAGEARNKSVDAETGDHVVFRDLDDYIDKDYFARLLPKEEENDVDFIDIDQATGEGKLIRSEMISLYITYDKEKFLRSQMTEKIFWGGARLLT